MQEKELSFVSIEKVGRLNTNKVIYNSKIVLENVIIMKSRKNKRVENLIVILFNYFRQNNLCQYSGSELY